MKAMQMPDARLGGLPDAGQRGRARLEQMNALPACLAEHCRQGAGRRRLRGALRAPDGATPKERAMKRFHVHMHVDDLAKNIAFYSAMFGAQPDRTESDYAKWMLQDPPVNFAISARGGRPGVGHLGIQVESAGELAAMKANAQKADMALRDEGETSCCYARSDKYWVTDPQGVAWEQFQTLDAIPVFSHEAAAGTGAGASACCAPEGKPPGIPVSSARSCC